MPILPWKTLTTREIYKNNWIRLREDQAELPNGHTTIYGVVECAECVGMLPFIDSNNVVMVRQYRYVYSEDFRWKMPTGGVNPGEPNEAAARRELREEAGYDAGDLLHVSTYFTSKSVMREIGHLYIGRNLIKAEAISDDTEL